MKFNDHSPTRAAIEAAREINENNEDDRPKKRTSAAVECPESHIVRLTVTGGVPLEIDHLIADHGFKISPSSARSEEVEIYK